MFTVLQLIILEHSNSNQIKHFVFEERGKPEYPKKKNCQRRVEKQQTQPTGELPLYTHAGQKR